jgi:broad specificity phosphatase PhoE
MEAPAVLPRARRPFLLPVWLTFAALFALLVCAVIAFFIYRAATTTVVVLTRHAEKEMNSIQDPPLSSDGERRAQRLAQMFSAASGPGRLDAIYVSDARRTQQTAAPLAERLGKTAVALPAADVQGTVARVLREHRGGTVLIVGHSNTLPALIRGFSGIDVPAIPDEEYGDVYIVSIPSFGHASVLRMQY